jgi:hypothetical protein
MGKRHGRVERGVKWSTAHPLGRGERGKERKREREKEGKRERGKEAERVLLLLFDLFSVI